MKYKDLVSDFISNWQATRTETLEILNSLDDKKLRFKPEGEKWKSLRWQFGCIIRTQIVYTQAVEKGVLDFASFGSSNLPSKDKLDTKEKLLSELKISDEGWIVALNNQSEKEDFKIKWPQYELNLLGHISSLMEHERLHHGQLISYFTMAGFELPPHFKHNWSL